MKRLSQSLTLFSVVFLLFACGGGGGSLERDGSTGGGSGSTPDPTYTVSVSLMNDTGDKDNDLSSDNPLTIVASVTDSNGDAVNDVLVTFSLSNPDLAQFGNDTGTARTNSEGRASLGLLVGSLQGAGQITATLPDSTVGTTSFDSQGDGNTAGESTIDITLKNQTGEADQTLSEDNPLTITVNANHADGTPFVDTLVTFTLSNSDIASFGNSTATARTNGNGIATLGLNVGTASGDGEVTATLPGGASASTTFSSTGTSEATDQPAQLELYTTSVQLPSSGSDSIELIALVKNSRSVLMEGVEVTFSAPTSAGVEIQQTDAQTRENGTARAILTSQNNAAKRDITITATAGSETQTIDISVFGTEVTINGSQSLIINDTATLTIRVQDSDGNSIPNQQVTFEPVSGGSLSADSVVTGANGQATVNFTATQAGTYTIEASALGVRGSHEITVQEDDFSFVSLPNGGIEVAASDAYDSEDYTTITVNWSKDGTAFAGGNVTFTASRGDIRPGTETGTTDANGAVTFDIASTNAGLSSITATGVDSSNNEVSATAEINFIASNAYSIQTDASPDQVGPDGQTSTITAIVRDPSGNLVQDKVVSFTVDDTSTGSISPSQASTDSNGIASTVFTSGAVTSEDAVRITATVLDTPSVTDFVTLTVGNRAFDISIGTGNEITKPDSTTYLKEFAVFVTDAAGQPIEGVALTASSTPVKFEDGGVYYKGEWEWVDPTWVPNRTAVCSNEDINGNGILDLSENEDTNDDGFLTPGIVGSLTFANGNNVTDANGQATLELRYPRSYAAFYEAEISVFGQSTGSEASASMEFLYTIAADDATNEEVQPPHSPFGTGVLCTNTD